MVIRGHVGVGVQLEMNGCETWKKAEREEGLLGAQAITGEEGARSLIESVSSMQRSGFHHNWGALPNI